MCTTRLQQQCKKKITMIFVYRKWKVHKDSGKNLAKWDDPNWQMSKSQGRYFEVHLPWLLLLRGEEASCEQSRLDVCKSAVLPLHHASSGKDQRRRAGYQCFFRFIVLKSFRNNFPSLHHLTNCSTKSKIHTRLLLHVITRIISVYIICIIYHYPTFCSRFHGSLWQAATKRNPRKTELAWQEKNTNNLPQTNFEVSADWLSLMLVLQLHSCCHNPYSSLHGNHHENRGNHHENHGNHHENHGNHTWT